MKKLFQNFFTLTILSRLLPFGLLLVFILAGNSTLAQVRKVQANGLTIVYESLGPANGNVMLLIGGTGSQLTAWPDAFCQRFIRSGFRVIRYDNRDVGLSTKFEAAGEPKWPAIIDSLLKGRPAPLAYTVDDMAKDAIGLLDALQIKKAHIVGVSGGSIIAQIVAAKYPERTWSLTSMMATSGNPALPQMKPEVQAFLGSILPPPAGDTAAIVARQVKISKIIGSQTYLTNEELLIKNALQATRRCYYPVGEARQGAAALVAGDRRNDLKKIKVPVLVLHGLEDPLVPVEAGKDVAANIPQAELFIISGMGHDLPLPLLPKVAGAIISHVTKVQTKK